MATQAVIEARGVYYKYPTAEEMALDGVDLQIYDGDFIAIIGMNGAGKTTLTKHFNGLYKPTKGNLYIQGADARSKTTNEIIQLVGYCYQNPDHQLFSRNVMDEVAYGPKNLGYSAEDIEKRVTEALEVTRLSGKEERDPFTLGRGERQRLAIASVISMKSPVLVVDEPTTGLDTHGITQIMTLLKEWNESGHTVVIVTHDIGIVAQYVPRTVVMSRGRIIADGDTRGVLAQKEKLQETFVKQPQVTRVATALAHLGVRPDVLTVRELRDQIVQAVSEPSSAPEGRG